MYLSQMGNIPLLSREREIFLAKQIELTRKWFRRKAMESDFALRLAVEMFEKVQAGELPFERTLRTSETENTRKEQIVGRLPVNLPTLKALLDRNAADWQAFPRRPPTTPPARRSPPAWPSAAASCAPWRKNSACGRTGSSRSSSGCTRSRRGWRRSTAS